MATTKTPEEIRAQNNAKLRRYRAKKKAEKEALAGVNVADVGTDGAGNAASAGGGEPSLVVNVKADSTPPRKLTFRERLGLGGNKVVHPATPAKRSTKKADKPNLLVTLLPTLLASLVAAWAKDRIADEYKPCAPSQAEVKAVLGPLMDIIGRRVEVAAEVSQDALDITNALICTMAYGVRAYVTYVDIKKAKEAGFTYEQKQQKQTEDYRQRIAREAAEYDSGINNAVSEPSLAGGLRAYQAASTGTDINSTGSDVSRPGGAVSGAYSNGAGNPADDQQLRDAEAKLVADLFKRDKQGRQQLGLLPRAV